MKQKEPYLFNDKEIYSASNIDAEFCLNTRKLIYRYNDERLDENFCARLGLCVGFNFHSESLWLSEDIVFIKFFSILSRIGVSHLWGIPAGYDFSSANSLSLETSEYSPPLIAKIRSSFNEYHKIRGGQVGLYSGQHLLISPCLNYFVLDFNGHYSLIMGPRQFVEDVLGVSVESSWDEVRKGTLIEPPLLISLRRAMAVYGY